MADRGKPRRSIRVDPEVWARWEQLAKAAGDPDVSTYLRRRADEPERASKRDVGALERELRELRARTAEQLEQLAAELRARG